MSQADFIDITSYDFPLDRPVPNVNALPPSPVLVMAAVLRTLGTDLSDESEVTRVLISAKFTSNQVAGQRDEAMALALAEPAN